MAKVSITAGPMDQKLPVAKPIRATVPGRVISKKASLPVKAPTRKM